MTQTATRVLARLRLRIGVFTPCLVIWLCSDLTSVLPDCEAILPDVSPT
jgi:hypothetical protein